jgi:hypothetical protein
MPDEAKQLKMPVIAYCQIQYAISSWEAHPEWRMKDYTGKDILVAYTRSDI